MFKIIDRATANPARSWQIAWLGLCITALAGALLVRFLAPHSPLDQAGSYQNCLYQIGDRAVLEEKAADRSIAAFVRETDLIALVEILEICPVGRSNGWRCPARVLDRIGGEALPSGDEATIDLLQINKVSVLRSFDPETMTITCHQPEMILWPGRRYLVFASAAQPFLAVDTAEKHPQYLLNRYCAAQPFAVIPVMDPAIGSIAALAADPDQADAGVRTLLCEAELTEVPGSGGALSYNLKQRYDFAAISQFNFFCIRSAVLDQYRQWCRDAVRDLRYNRN